ncbi:hypothetical protein AVEN_262381-1 [Araneus ventricosus]|uniref:Uncharacterized protein n=1 Tax=Araneus ventricosus TaxID=182803 RepID=A0A4Y2IJQ6_ARAVE|nr:hypothetical protein AVEN_262381-1 [Araneus ventricosus]
MFTDISSERSSHPNFRRTTMNLCLPTMTDKLYFRRANNRRKRALDKEHEPRSHVKHPNWTGFSIKRKSCWFVFGLDSLDEQGFVGWLEPSCEMSVNARSSKASDSSDGDRSTFHNGYCRLCMWHGKDAASGILTSNKNPTTDVERLNPDYGSRA